MKLLDFLPRPFFAPEDETGTSDQMELFEDLPVGEDTASGDDTVAGDDISAGDDTASSDDIIKEDEVTFDSEAIEFNPETFEEDFKDMLPEDFTADPEGMAEFVKGFNECNSRSEMMKFVFNQLSEYNKAAAETANENWQNTIRDWQKASREHPEFGGDKFAESAANAKLVAKEYGGQEFFDFLKLTGGGNHPAMLAFLNRIHAELPQEGKPLSGGQPTQAEKSLADKLFGN